MSAKHETDKPTGSQLRCFCKRLKSFWTSSRRTDIHGQAPSGVAQTHLCLATLPLPSSPRLSLHCSICKMGRVTPALQGCLANSMSTVPGAQRTDGKPHGNHECTAPARAIGSPTPFYSPPESKLQTFLTGPHAQTQEPGETKSCGFPFQGSSSAPGALETPGPLSRLKGPGAEVTIDPGAPVSRV